MGFIDWNSTWFDISTHFMLTPASNLSTNLWWLTVCEGGESGERTQLHNVWKTGDLLRDNPIIKVRQAGVEAQVSYNARYINSRLESSRRDHRKQGQYQEVRNNMNKQQRDTRLNTNGGGVTGLTTIHMNKNNTEQDLQIKPETGSGIRNSTRNRNLYTEMTRKEKWRTRNDIENV